MDNLGYHARDLAWLLMDLIDPAATTAPCVERRDLVAAWKREWPESDATAPQTEHRLARRGRRSHGTSAGIEIRKAIRKLENAGILRRGELRGTEFVMILDVAGLREQADADP